MSFYFSISFFHLCVCMFACICACLHVCMLMCVYLHVCACLCLCACLHVYVCLWVCVHVCICEGTCLHCVYMFACVYGHVCMCGSTCLHACVGMHGVQNHPQWLSLFTEPGSLRQSMNSVIRLVSLANLLWASPLGTFGDWHDKRATIPSCILRDGFGGSELQSQAYKAST